ncbi:hypothetical protein PBY51_000385 [Eleginops maclovinus]|uniref:Uncharacterized protein n=2 Tax=Eleginops maclovinus TaxID=56733 RepID=A0AAN7XLR5_ELEMC|nr:hypothetical protein PBY51_000385 [Eleginops maclovinus]
MKKCDNLEHKYSQWILSRILHAGSSSGLQSSYKRVGRDSLQGAAGGPFRVNFDALEFARASLRMFHTQHMKINRQSEEQEEEIHFLTESLPSKRMELEMVKKYRNMEQDQFNDMKRYFNKTLTMLKADVCVIQQEIAKLKTVQQEIMRKVSQVIQEKEDEIARVRQEMIALVERNLESLANVREINTQIRQIEALKKEENLRKTQELQKQIRELEEEWLTKESMMEKKELVFKTDKVKEKRRMIYLFPI